MPYNSAAESFHIKKLRTKAHGKQSLRLSDFGEIWYVGALWIYMIEIGTGSRNEPSMAAIMNFVSGAYVSRRSRYLRQIRYVGKNQVTGASKWPKCICDWIHIDKNRNNSAVDCPIMLNFVVCWLCVPGANLVIKNRERLAGLAASCGNAALTATFSSFYIIFRSPLSPCRHVNSVP